MIQFYDSEICAKEHSESVLKVPHLSLHNIQCNSFQLCNHHDFNNTLVTTGFTLSYSSSHN